MTERYGGFARQELALRREARYPPFARMVGCVRQRVGVVRARRRVVRLQQGLGLHQLPAHHAHGARRIVADGGLRRRKGAPRGKEAAREMESFVDLAAEAGERLPDAELPDDFDFGKVRNWTRKVPSKRLQTIVGRRTSELESA